MRAVQPRRRAALIILAAILGCGDAVTDPLDDFAVSPAPVLGRWITVTTTSDTLDADIQRGAGFLFGEFEFERTGIGFDLQFSDATWDGSRFLFSTPDPFGTSLETIPWTALLVAPDESQSGEAALRLFPRINGAIPFSVEYVRPD